MSKIDHSVKFYMELHSLRKQLAEVDDAVSISDIQSEIVSFRNKYMTLFAAERKNVFCLALQPQFFALHSFCEDNQVQYQTQVQIPLLLDEIDLTDYKKLLKQLCRYYEVAEFRFQGQYNKRVASPYHLALFSRVKVVSLLQSIAEQAKPVERSWFGFPLLYSTTILHDKEFTVTVKKEHYLAIANENKSNHPDSFSASMCECYNTYIAPCLPWDITVIEVDQKEFKQKHTIRLLQHVPECAVVYVFQGTHTKFVDAIPSKTISDVKIDTPHMKPFAVPLHRKQRLGESELMRLSLMNLNNWDAKYTALHRNNIFDIFVSITDSKLCGVLVVYCDPPVQYLTEEHLAWVDTKKKRPLVKRKPQPNTRLPRIVRYFNPLVDGSHTKMYYLQTPAVAELPSVFRSSDEYTVSEQVIVKQNQIYIDKVETGIPVGNYIFVFQSKIWQCKVIQNEPFLEVKDITDQTEMISDSNFIRYLSHLYYLVEYVFVLVSLNPKNQTIKTADSKQWLFLEDGRVLEVQLDNSTAVVYSDVHGFCFDNVKSTWIYVDALGMCEEFELKDNTKPFQTKDGKEWKFDSESGLMLTVTPKRPGIVHQELKRKVYLLLDQCFVHFDNEDAFKLTLQGGDVLINEDRGFTLTVNDHYCWQIVRNGETIEAVNIQNVSDDRSLPFGSFSNNHHLSPISTTYSSIFPDGLIPCVHYFVEQKYLAVSFVCHLQNVLSTFDKEVLHSILLLRTQWNWEQGLYFENNDGFHFSLRLDFGKQLWVLSLGEKSYQSKYKVQDIDVFQSFVELNSIPDYSSPAQWSLCNPNETALPSHLVADLLRTPGKRSMLLQNPSPPSIAYELAPIQLKDLMDNTAWDDSLTPDVWDDSIPMTDDLSQIIDIFKNMLQEGKEKLSYQDDVKFTKDKGWIMGDTAANIHPRPCPLGQYDDQRILTYQSDTQVYISGVSAQFISALGDELNAEHIILRMDTKNFIFDSELTLGQNTVLSDFTRTITFSTGIQYMYAGSKTRLQFGCDQNCWSFFHNDTRYIACTSTGQKDTRSSFYGCFKRAYTRSHTPPSFRLLDSRFRNPNEERQRFIVVNDDRNLVNNLGKSFIAYTRPHTKDVDWNNKASFPKTLQLKLQNPVSRMVDQLKNFDNDSIAISGTYKLHSYNPTKRTVSYERQPDKFTNSRTDPLLCTMLSRNFSQSNTPWKITKWIESKQEYETRLKNKITQFKPNKVPLVSISKHSYPRCVNGTYKIRFQDGRDPKIEIQSECEFVIPREWHFIVDCHDSSYDSKVGLLWKNVYKQSSSWQDPYVCEPQHTAYKFLFDDKKAVMFQRSDAGVYVEKYIYMSSNNDKNMIGIYRRSDDQTQYIIVRDIFSVFKTPNEGGKMEPFVSAKQLGSFLEVAHICCMVL